MNGQVKAYYAAPFAMRGTIAKAAELIERVTDGRIVSCARWLIEDGDDEQGWSAMDFESQRIKASSWAVQDMTDIDNADIFILWSASGPQERFSRIFELGYYCGLPDGPAGRCIHIVGKRMETIFHALPNIAFYDDTVDLIHNFYVTEIAFRARRSDGEKGA